MNKKYFSINEVSNITGFSHSQLRYLEKTNPDIKIHQINSRRYYTQENINLIQKNHAKLLPFEQYIMDTQDHQQKIEQLDQLIAKFRSLIQISE
jgi:DNA-binding transcriptional MerR regulator